MHAVSLPSLIPSPWCWQFWHIHCQQWDAQ